MKKLILLLLAASLLSSCIYYERLIAKVHPGGLRPSYPAQDYDSYLTQIANTATPLFEALAEYKKKNKKYPKSLLSLKVKTINTANTYRRWQYFTNDGKSFSLFQRLGWDPSLSYSTSKKSWEFNPGDGAYPKKIKLEIQTFID